MKLKCQKCEKKWDYNGEKKFTPKYTQYVTCPTCHTNVKVI